MVPGTPTPPRRAATRPSCSRRSTSSRRRCATRWPAACARTASSTSREVGLDDEMLRRLRRIFIVACGTSYHAGLIVSYAIEQLARVPVQIDVASEFRYREPVLRRRHARHRHHAVGRDGRHARRDAPRARGRLAGARAHQPHGQPGHARGRLRAVHARRARDRRGGDQDAHRPGRRPAPARAPPRVGARRHARGRAQAPRARAARRARAGRAAAGAAERHRGDRPALPRRALLPLPGPRHGLRRLSRGRPQAQGDQLHPDRGLRRRRDEARPHRPARQRVAGRGRRRRQPRSSPSSSATSRRSGPAAPT